MLSRQPPPPKRKPLHVPTHWLMCDARLGEAMPGIVAAMPPRSAVVVRPYAMQKAGRVATIRSLRRAARAKRHLLLLAGAGNVAGYDGRHGGLGTVGRREQRQFLSWPVHDVGELTEAIRAKADAVLISPLHATRSHPNIAVLGMRGFARLAAAAQGKAIALGGMTHRRYVRARIHGASGWAAIDTWLAKSGQR